MNEFVEQNVSLEKCPALVLNADYRPLSYYPLSLWSWQDAVKSVFLDRVSIVSNYKRKIRSPSFEMNLPSVIALKNFIKPSEHHHHTFQELYMANGYIHGLITNFCFSKVMIDPRKNEPYWSKGLIECRGWRGEYF